MMIKYRWTRYYVGVEPLWTQEGPKQSQKRNHNHHHRRIDSDVDLSRLSFSNVGALRFDHITEKPHWMLLRSRFFRLALSPRRILVDAQRASRPNHHHHLQCLSETKSSHRTKIPARS